MEFNRCYGCMEEITAFPCPHCGYAPGSKGPDYALRPGSILNGKYIVGRILGQGGFGITYIGWDLMLERKVAIKEYYPSGQVIRLNGSALQWGGTQQAINARESGRDMFLKEARKMNKVRKIPQVVQVLDLFQENDTAYIVMDFIEGETLTRRLKKTGPLSWGQMQKIFLPVIQAMEEVHKAGLIHRDLSPDNLMLLPDGGVQILDLGAAKDLSLNSGASSMQVAKGGFSPLEQYHQRGGSGTWTDVYALAATIYYALTGTVPPAAVERVDEDNLRWDLPRLQALPPKGIHALKKAMTLRAKDRTQTMEELYQGIAVPEIPKPEKKEKKAAKEKPVPAKTAPAKTIPETPVTGKKEPAKPEKVEKKRGKLLLPVGTVVVCVVIAAAAVLWKPVIRPNLDYSSAIKLMEAGQYEEAIAAFEALEGFQDNAQRIEDCEAGILEQRYEAAVSLMNAGKYEEALSILETLDGYQDRAAILELRYQAAVSLMNQGKYEEAMAVFEALEGYKDSAEKLEETIRMEDYATAEELLSVGDRYGAATAFYAMGDYRDARERSFAIWEEIAPRETVSAGGEHTAGLKADGTVVAVGLNGDGQCDVSGWQDCVAISAGNGYTIGLKADGTVVAVGSNGFGQCDVSDWRDCVAVSAGWCHTVGLKADGTVMAVGDNREGQCDVSGWTDIVAVSVRDRHTIGLKADGTVVAVGSNLNGQCDVSGWRDCVAVSTERTHTVGLKADGTVVAVGDTGYGKCNVSGWQDCVAVDTGVHYTVGLKDDGMVVAVGSNEYGNCNVSGWQNCVAVSAGTYHTVGLKSDGTVVAVGWSEYGQCNVSGWTDIKLPK
ncbi:MAG: protein kinase [Faecousia sp.]